jgi:hypothetical protein
LAPSQSNQVKKKIGSSSGCWTHATGNHWRAYPFGILVWQQGRTIDLGNAVTDAKGVAIFLLPSAIPERIGISHSPIELQWCSDEGFPTGQILKTGMVAECKCDQVKLKTTPTAAVGELVLFAIRFTFWERVLREIP